MSYNGAGVFQINTAGQPVVSGTTISSTVFNALTADLATGLSNCVTKDGQQTITANIPMSNFKFTGLGSGSAATDSARIDNCNVLDMCEFRLTGTSGTPVTTGDVTAIETVYFTPFRGNRIALYDGSKWVMRTSAELSIDVPDATNMYDVFVYDNSGTPALELTAWTNDTTRATALTTLDGVLVKSGTTTRRYVGSFYCTTAGNGQTEDSVANRYLWNYYNRVEKTMSVAMATGTYAYTSSTIRQANGSTTYQLNFCVGVSETMVRANVLASGSALSGQYIGVYIGLDSTTARATDCFCANTRANTVDYPSALVAEYKGFPGIGKHYLSWLESGGTNGAFYGAGTGGAFTGIQGAIFC